jgi:hypothetical protein
MRLDIDQAGCMTRYDASPETALAAIRSHAGPVIVDLDETLYLRNSTEDFIDSARPGLGALILMRILDLLQPWRWTGGMVTRDVWRVGLISALYPWVWRRWRIRVTELAAASTNRPLLNVLQSLETMPIIATVGFRPIVEPLVAAMGLPNARIVAVRLHRFQDRRRGKLATVTEALGEETLRRSLLVTDSLDDLPILNICARPLRTIWPQARYRMALSDVYIPGQYLGLVKRPGERYFMRGILQEDFAFWVLSSVALAPHPFLHVVALFVLLLSFWAIYEYGYMDNDLAATRFENDPKLSAAYQTISIKVSPWEPWIWALALGAIALLLLRYPNAPQPLDAAKWIAVLLASHGWFRLYNRFDKTTRSWMYAGLQLARGAAFAVLVPVTLIGTVALGAHIVSRWVPYYVYRVGRKEWPDAPADFIRLLFFVVLSLLFGIALGFSVLVSWTALALFAWNLFRARQGLRDVFSTATRLDRRTERTESS